MEFGVLGPLEVVSAGQPVPLGGPKQRALLAILLLSANEPVSRDRLVDGVWGERPPANPGQAIDTYVSRLRKQLGADRINRRSGGYALRIEPGELDLDRFEELAGAGRYGEALAVWRGPALADLLFEPFAQHEAPRLEERRLVVVEEQMDAALEAGRAADLVPELEHLVREHPLRERLLGQLMVALYRAGRQAAALDVYRRAKQYLAEELGLQPGRQLQELELRILEQDRTLGAAARRGSRRSGWKLALGPAVVAVAAGVAAGIVLGTRGAGAVRLPSSTASRLVSFDAASGHIEAVSTPADAPAALAYGFGSLWAANPNGGQVLRIDGSGAVTDRIALAGQPSAIAVGSGAVWVGSAVGGLVSRIDPATDQVTQTQRLGGATASALLFAGGKLWVADQTDHSVVQIDPENGSVLRSISLDLAPTALAYAGGQLWAAGFAAGAVDEIDLASGQVVARLAVGQGPAALTAAAGSIWVANSLDGTLTRIDEVTAQTRSTTPVGAGPAGLTTAGGSVWIADEVSGKVSEIDARSGELRAEVHAGGRPTTLASSGTRVWVGAGPSASLHRGGTLTMSGTVRPNSLDPAFQLYGSWEPTQLTRLVYDTLVTFANASGATGLRLVPDLALQLPQATDEGRTFRFRLRPGIRYSTGKLVRAADFKRAFERLFRARSPATDFYTSILGAGACLARPKGCDLSAGIVTDDAAGTVTFHLAKPDPDFLFKLTEFALGAPIPPGLPPRDLGYSPVPGTGPYRFTHAAKDGLRLERNPYFDEWSHAAQPDGNPDTIVWRFPTSHEREIRSIEEGKADWTLDFIPIPRLRTILRTRPGQLHVNPSFIVEFIGLNTKRPPFDSLKVRRALNLAIDRRVIARLYGGAVVGTPLCQPIPPGMPGHIPYCPYTRNPDRMGAYNGPDLASARRLVRESGRLGSKVTVWGAANATAIPPGEPAYVARVLKSLGFVVTVRFRGVTEADRPSFQIVIDGDWLPDFPSAASFLPGFFACDGVHNKNGFYCDRKLDRLMSRATLADAGDPARAARLWATANRMIVDNAYWVPTISLNEVDLVSSRLHNYVYSPVWGFLAAQAWAR